MPRFINSPPPQTVPGPGISQPLPHSALYLQVTADCFVCFSADGSGVDGQPVGATNGHFMRGGVGLDFRDIPLGSRLGISAGTAYISFING